MAPSLPGSIQYKGQPSWSASHCYRFATLSSRNHDPLPWDVAMWQIFITSAVRHVEYAAPWLLCLQGVVTTAWSGLVTFSDPIRTAHPFFPSCVCHHHGHHRRRKEGKFGMLDDVLSCLSPTRVTVRRTGTRCNREKYKNNCFKK